jgi:acyl carrier protein
VEERLKRVLADVFEMDEGEITDDSSPESVALWDSLNHLKMVTQIETVFEIRLAMKEVQSMTEFRKIKEIVAFHLDGRSGQAVREQGGTRR